MSTIFSPSSRQVYSDTKITAIDPSQNPVVDLQLSNLERTNISIFVTQSNPSPNTTFNFYDNSGIPISTPLTIKQPSFITFTNSKVSKFTASDTLSYQIIVAYTIIDYYSESIINQIPHDFAVIPLALSVLTSIANPISVSSIQNPVAVSSVQNPVAVSSVQNPVAVSSGNLTQVGGTNLTPADWTPLLQKLNQLDVALSTRADANTLSIINNKLYTGYGDFKALSLSIGTTATQISTDTNLRRVVNISASPSNTDTVFIGTSTSQAFPLRAGADLTIYSTKLFLIYARANSGTQTIYVVYGGW